MLEADNPSLVEQPTNAVGSSSRDRRESSALIYVESGRVGERHWFMASAEKQRLEGLGGRYRIPNKYGNYGFCKRGFKSPTPYHSLGSRSFAP